VVVNDKGSSHWYSHNQNCELDSGLISGHLAV
jgi:hypothetical protein